MMDSANPRVVESAAELLQEVTLTIDGITFYKISAELREDADDLEAQISEIAPSYGLKINAEGDSVAVRLSTRLETAVGYIEVDAAINYKAPYPVIVPSETRLEFANEVGIMALIPFIREAIADVSQKVFGQTILMPILQRGELSFSPEDRTPEEDDE